MRKAKKGDDGLTMVKIALARIKNQEEMIKRNKIRRDNIISATPILDDQGALVTIFVFDDGESDA